MSSPREFGRRTVQSAPQTFRASPTSPPPVQPATPIPFASLIPLLFGFEGRIGRTTFWLTSLVLNVIGAMAYALVLVASLGQGGVAALASGHQGPSLSLLPVALVMAWIGFALQVKRWHDRDKSWLWVLISFIPLIGPLWALVECGFLPGTPGGNLYGPSPRHPVLED